MTTEIVYNPLIIPSIVIPFTALLAGLSALATLVAGYFGVKLKAEGPKKLLELMLKPKILLVAIVTNVAVLGSVRLYQYWKNAPLMLWRIEKTQKALAAPSRLDYRKESAAIERASEAFGRNGKLVLKWSQNLGSGSFRGAAPAGDSLFVGTDSGYVFELNSSTGEIRRKFFLGTAVSAAPHIFEGSLFAGEGLHDVHHARLYKFDLATGQLVSTFTSVGHIEGESASGRVGQTRVIVVPTGKGGVVALNADTMTPLWNATDGHVDSSAQIVGNMVFVGTGLEKDQPGKSKGTALAYDLLSGKKIWQQELPASSWMRPMAWKDKICFVFGEVYFASDLGGVYCFKQIDGSPDVAYNNAAPIVADLVAVGENDVLTSDLKGKVCRVSLIDGRAKWCQLTPVTKSAFANATFDSGRNVVVYPSKSDGIYFLQPETGEILVQWKSDENGSKPAKIYAGAATVSDGWIIVDMDGVIRKIAWSPSNNSGELAQQSGP